MPGTISIGNEGMTQHYEPIAQLDTVVFSKLLDRDPEQIKKLISSCEKDGFFYLDISDQYSAKMLKTFEELSSTMKQWFAQPTEVKLKEFAISMASHGYKPIGSQAGTHGGRDGWEVLKTGRFELEGRWGLPKVVEDNYESFSTFQSQCHYITHVLLDRISNALGMRGAQSLNNFHRNNSPSKNYGTLTLVFAPQWGLQVFSPENKGNPSLEWEFVEPRPGCAIVNVADVLRFLTNDRLKSAVHRVLPLPDVDRYSTTYFLRPNDDLDFTDGDGNMTNVLDWYDRKNNMYEAPSNAQDRSLLVGGLYKQL
ncbi:hypothetical protein BKA64DRAFT_697724 [Cadophora sp. MPI-SDFR-AT-0126]|nr:hypothetical protein BKA64DRAFT_697724 [Leotiomycetes sp. MPI-SDFR-AT-0126]